MVKKLSILLILILFSACSPSRALFEDVNLEKSEVEDTILFDIENKKLVSTTTDATCTEFFGTALQKFVYDVVALDNSLYSEFGYDMRSVSDVRLKIVPMSEVTSLCGDEAEACNAADTIYIPKDYYTVNDFLSTLFHEIGHSRNWGNYEFVSISNKLNLIFLSYIYSRPVGSLLIDRNLFDALPHSDLEKYPPFYRMYYKGSLFSVANIFYHNGNIMEAMHFVSNSNPLMCEGLLDEVLSKTSGNIADRYFQLWQMLLDDNMFFINLSQFIDPVEADELVAYLQIKNNYANIIERTNRYESVEILKELEAEFVSNPQYKNPFFKAIVVASHTRTLFYELIQLTTDAVQDPEAIINLGQRIIEINKLYPCWVSDIYTCPEDVRGPRIEHILTYDIVVGTVFNQGNFDYRKNSVGLVVDFANRFFRGANIEAGNIGSIIRSGNANVNNIFTGLVSKVALYEYLYGSKELAKKLCYAGLAVSCLEGATTRTYNECLLSQLNIRTILDYIKLQEE